MWARARTLTPLAVAVTLIAAVAAPQAGAAPGSFTTSEVFGGFGAAAVVAGDFDGEDGPDLAIANLVGDGVSVLLNKGNGTFDPAPINPPIKVGKGPGALWTGRLNGDAVLDLVVVNSGSNNLSVLFGTGDGTFVPGAQTPAVGSNPAGIAAGAFDAQPGIDVAVTNFNSNSVSLLLNDGSDNGTFLPSFQTATGLLPSALVAGQFDSSTPLDELLVANEGSQTVTPVLASGASAFLPGGSPTAITAGLFDSAPGLDTAVAFSQNTGRVAVLLGSGSVSFEPAPASPFAVGQGPAGIVAGDLDGGARADLAVANNGSRNVTILLNDGSARFKQPSTSPQAAGNAPTGIAMADLNGDGLNDLAVSNYSSGQISIMINDPGSCAGRRVTLTGTSGRDRLVGTRGRDVIAGRGGNDTVRGLAGADTICAGAGTDRIAAGPGADRVDGGPGRDRVLGNAGRDRLLGGSGPDRLHGGPGRDRCRPGQGRDARPRSC